MSLISTLLTKKLSQEGVDDTAAGVDPEKRDDTAAPAPAPEAPAAVAPEAEPAPVAPAEATPATPEGEAATTPEVTPADPVAVSDPVADPVVDPVDPAAPAVDPVDPTGEPAPVEGEPTEPLDQLPEPGADSDLTPEAQAAAEEGDDLEVDSDTDTEEDLEAKADEVAEYTDAAQSLEEIAATIEETLNDGGMTPEAVTLAQGSVNDILDDVGEEPIGLPSQESFTTFVGRQQNTRLVMESIGEKAKELAGKAWAAVLALVDMIVKAAKSLRARFTRSSKVAKGSEQLLLSFTKKQESAKHQSTAAPVEGKPAAPVKEVPEKATEETPAAVTPAGVVENHFPPKTWEALGIVGSGTIPLSALFKREAVLRKAADAVTKWVADTISRNAQPVVDLAEYCSDELMKQVAMRSVKYDGAVLAVPNKAEYAKLLTLTKQADAHCNHYLDIDAGINKLRSIRDGGTMSPDDAKELSYALRTSWRIVSQYANFTDTLAGMVTRIAKPI